MTNLGAVVAGILLMVTVKGNLSVPVTLVTNVFFLAALAGKMTEPVTLVALGSTVMIASKFAIPATILTSTSSIIMTSVSFGTLTGKVTYTVTTVGDISTAATSTSSTFIVRRALTGKVTNLVAPANMTSDWLGVQLFICIF